MAPKPNPNPEPPDQARLLAEHVQRLKPILEKHKAGKKLTRDELALLKSPPPVPVYDSLKSAASALGLPLYLLKRAKKEITAAFRGSRVYLTDDLRLWLDAQDTEPVTQDKSYWDAANAKQKFDHDAWRFEVERSLYKPKKEFAAELIALGAAQKALLRQKLENEFPALVPGLEPAQRASLKSLARQLADELCRRMQRLVDSWKD